MKLTLYRPSEQVSYDASCIEVETSLGNFVILEHHAPIILLLKENSEIIVSLANQEKIIVPITSGILKVTRSEVTILLTE